jgi:[ribosomal protein S5]-alanine N-acetyltransferase
VPERTTLRTERLVLRPFEAGDVDDALAYRDDLELARYLPHIPQPFTRRDAEKFVRQNMDEPWIEFATFAVVREGHVVGTANLQIDSGETEGMLGYALARSLWGQGLASEAARAVVDWGFGPRGLERIWASTDTRNTRSMRVLEKLGMTQERIAPAKSPGRDGAPHDEVFFGLSRSAWAAKRSR